MNKETTNSHNDHEACQSNPNRDQKKPNQKEIQTTISPLSPAPIHQVSSTKYPAILQPSMHRKTNKQIKQANPGNKLFCRKSFPQTAHPNPPNDSCYSKNKTRKFVRSPSPPSTKVLIISFSTTHLNLALHLFPHPHSSPLSSPPLWLSLFPLLMFNPIPSQLPPPAELPTPAFLPPPTIILTGFGYLPPGLFIACGGGSLGPLGISRWFHSSGCFTVPVPVPVPVALFPELESAPSRECARSPVARDPGRRTGGGNVKPPPDPPARDPGRPPSSP